MPIHVNVMGRLGKDAVAKQIHPSNGGTPRRVIEFSLATDGRKGAIWLDCTILGTWGEAYLKHLKRGRIILVTGLLEPKESFLNVTVDRIEYGPRRDPKPEDPGQ